MDIFAPLVSNPERPSIALPATKQDYDSSEPVLGQKFSTS